MIALNGDEVIERWRVELAGDNMPVQPYHAAEPLPFVDAERLIQRCEAISRRMAREELDRLSTQKIRAACVLSSSARPLPELRAVLASHALIHTAEGELYRDSLRQALADMSVRLVEAREKEVFSKLPGAALARIESYGKILGPPWRQDQKLATAAAWIAQSVLAKGAGR